MNDIEIPKHTVKKRITAKKHSVFGSILVYSYIEGNIVRVLRPKHDRNVIPNLTLQFASSWDTPLTHKYVIDVLNYFIETYNVSFKVYRYDIAVDLVTHRNSKLYRYIRNHIQSGKNHKPKYDIQYHRYIWHTDKSRFQLVCYDKKEHMLIKHYNDMSNKAQRFLSNNDVYRLEFRFKKDTLCLNKALLDNDTSFTFDLYPSYIRILDGNIKPLNKKGITCNDSINRIKQQLRKQGVQSNHHRYFTSNDYLTKQICEALKSFLWITNARTTHRVPKLPESNLQFKEIS